MTAKDRFDLSIEECRELVHICKERNELDFLYNISKEIALHDSIGECYGYCDEYPRDYFDEMIDKFISLDDIPKGWCIRSSLSYMLSGGLPVYKLYLMHIGEIK